MRKIVIALAASMTASIHAAEVTNALNNLTTQLSTLATTLGGGAIPTPEPEIVKYPLGEKELQSTIPAIIEKEKDPFEALNKIQNKFRELKLNPEDVSSTTRAIINNAFKTKYGFTENEITAVASAILHAKEIKRPELLAGNTLLQKLYFTDSEHTKKSPIAQFIDTKINSLFGGVIYSTTYEGIINQNPDITKNEPQWKSDLLKFISNNQKKNPIFIANDIHQRLLAVGKNLATFEDKAASEAVETLFNNTFGIPYRVAVDIAIDLNNAETRGDWRRTLPENSPRIMKNYSTYGNIIDAAIKAKFRPLTGYLFPLAQFPTYRDLIAEYQETPPALPEGEVEEEEILPPPLTEEEIQQLQTPQFKTPEQTWEGS